MKKKGMGIICAVLCMVLAAGITLFAQAAKPEKEKSKSFLNKLPRLEEEQMATVEYEGLKAKMISCVFDRETNIGLSIFEITASESGELEHSVHSLEYKGEGYSIQCPCGGGYAQDFEEQNGKLYMWLPFQAWPEEEQDVFLGLYEGDDFDHPVGKIELGNRYSSEQVLYFGPGKSMTLSSIGLKTDGNKLQDEREITLRYQDGTEKTVALPGSGGGGNGYGYEFEKVIDIAGVTSIINDGIEYERYDNSEK